MSVYRRAVDRIVVNFEDESYTVDVAGRADVKNKLDEIWRSLSAPYLHEDGARSNRLTAGG